MAQAELKITGDFEELAELLASLRKDGLTVTVGDPEPAFTEPTTTEPTTTETTEPTTTEPTTKSKSKGWVNPYRHPTHTALNGSYPSERKAIELARVPKQVQNQPFVNQRLVSLLLMQFDYPVVTTSHLEDVIERHKLNRSSVTTILSRLKRYGFIKELPKSKIRARRFTLLPQPEGWDTKTDQDWAEEFKGV